jgi:murein DD-endopeptidase MepM/ murein hydrolase activator NlpD
MQTLRSKNPRTAIATGFLVALLALVVAAVPSGGGSAEAATTSGVKTGGLLVPGVPKVDDVVCVRQCVSPRAATPGATVRVVGEYLDRVNRVVFPGRGKNVPVKYRARSYRTVRVVVPKAAVKGRPFVISAGGRRSRAPRELKVLPVSRIPKEVFPVRGPYNFGSSGARFGAARSGYAHQGQDVMAPCGTRLVSIRRARVLYNKYHSAAGWYVVLRNLGTNSQFAYMHLMRKSPLRAGQVVDAGQPIGLVGQTGRAYGCHLHFEFWLGAWQTGGKPINPLPYLRSL